MKEMTIKQVMALLSALLIISALSNVQSAGALPAITPFYDDLDGFNTAAGFPPVVVSFDDIAPDTNITGLAMGGATFERNLLTTSAPLLVVKADDTYSPSGFWPSASSDNKLFATSGENVLSPGGVELSPGLNATAENDDLTLIFIDPVYAVGFDVLFQSLDGYSFTSVKILDIADSVLYEIDQIPILGSEGAPGGTTFVGFVSDSSDIAKIVIDDQDDNNYYADCNIGFDTIRFNVPTLIVTAAASPNTIYSGGTSKITISTVSDGNPIPDATVTLASDRGGSFSAATNHANGTYTATFTGPLVAASTLCTIAATATKSGYATSSGQTQVTVQPLPLTVTATASPATIYSGGTATIRVSAASGGTAVTGATAGFTSNKGGTFSTVTDHANGTYTATFTAPEETSQTTCIITAAVTKSGYTSSSEQTQVTVQPLVLRIYVKDADGNPIAEATVVSTSQPSGQTALSGTTDTTGLVVFTGILKGSYTIKASETGYEDKTSTITVIAGPATTETITLSKTAAEYPWIWIITGIVVVVFLVAAFLAMKKRKRKG